jgi:DNA-binding NarL/FixJ family response regulator
VAIQDLDAPSDLRAITFQGDGVRYLMLSFPVQGGEPAPQLTAAEREVLQAVLDGRTNASIARDRGTAVRTVANQVAALFRKFGASSRLDLARRASSLVVGRDRL